MKINRYKLGLFVIISFGLINCGGGASNVATTQANNNIILPDCLIGSKNYTGCWISELCADNTGGLGARLLTEVIELSSSTEVVGSVNEYLLEYSDLQCNGSPVTIKQLNSINAGNFVQTYIQREDTECSESGGTSNIPCKSLDINIVTNQSDITGFTTILITNGIRICMPSIDYNFDETGSGGLQAQSTSTRDTILDILPGACALKFTPFN